MLTSLKRFVRRIDSAIALRRHRARLGSARSGYADAQLRRTLVKRDQPLQPRTRYLVDRLAERVDLRGASVLCVGCRNVRELEYVRSKGAARATGIDLFSEHPDILVMDMHAMTFAPASFNVVYSSHSLEHAHSPAQAIAEFARVLKPGGAVLVEVPVRFTPTATDLVDFGSAGGLIAAFQPYGPVVLMQDEQDARTPLNSEGTPIARVLMRLTK